MPRLGVLLPVMLVMLYFSEQASACSLEYEMSSPQSPIFLKGTTSTAGDLLSLSIDDASGKLLVYQNLFAEVDQQNAQLLMMLSQIMRQQSAMAASIVRNIAGSTLTSDAPTSVTAQAGDSYSLILSSSEPGFTDISLPLSCSGACDGMLSGQWSFVRYVPEPGTLSLLAFGLVGLSLSRRCNQKWRRPIAGS